ncbi:MAG: type VI secretion system tip protein VgrG [Planctomycetes bacterium]|nr:type VI secretion system tip protein VgrG [Planctomycetota bacterium]
MARTQQHRMMAIGTPLGADVLLLRSFSATEQLGRMFHIEADLLSEDENISFDDLVGRNVTIRLDTSQGSPRYFNGLVAGFTQRRRTTRLAAYHATIVPWLWLLTRTSDCRIFQERKVPDIIKEIFRDHGLTDFEDRLTGSYRQWEYCVQYRETDFNFVSRLMEQEGIYYYFEHEDGKHTMVLCDSPSAHQPYSGYETISYRPPELSATEAEHIRDWSCRKQVQPGAYVLEDFDFKSPRKDLEVNSKITRQHSAADFEMYDYPGEYTEFGDGQKYARVRIEEAQAEHEVVGGDSDVRGICTGYKFRLSDYPRSDQCRDYLVTSASVSGRSDEFDSSGGGGGGVFCSCSFTGIEASTQFRSPRLTPKPVVQGPQTAIVVGPAGEEIYTDQYGRVKVQFHWDRRSKGDETSSCWIRVSQIWAGKKWGGMIIPRIGQELIVDFLEGDPDQPIGTGRVYNGEAMPPNELPGQKVKMSLKSNSTKGGGGYNEITLDDTKSKEGFYVHAQYNKDERVENDSKEWIGNDRHLIVTNNQYELIKADKHLHVKGDHKEKIDGSMSLTVGSDLDEKIGMKWAADAGQEIHLKAGMKVVIEAGMQLTIKVGGNFVDIGPAGVTIVGTMVKINSGGAAGTGSGASPDAPDDAKEAATGSAGQVDQAVTKPRPPTPPTYSSQARVMQRAAESGAPTVEQCPS